MHDAMKNLPPPNKFSFSFWYKRTGILQTLLLQHQCKK